jgi:hypothetical protein
MRVLRYWDLKAQGITGNRTGLQRQVDDCGFPLPVELGPNSKGWYDSEVDLWIDVRTLTSPEFDELSKIRMMTEAEFADFSEKRSPRANELDRWLQIRAMTDAKWLHLQNARPRAYATANDGKPRGRGNRAGRATEAARPTR